MSIHPEQRVLGADGRLHFRYGIDLRHAMLDNLPAGATGARPKPADLWASLPLAMRQHLCTQALGSRGIDVYGKGWDAIEFQQRVAIGAKLRDMARGLV